MPELAEIRSNLPTNGTNLGPRKNELKTDLHKSKICPICWPIWPYLGNSGICVCKFVLEPRLPDLAPKWVRLAPRQNVLKLILKSPRFVQFGANLTQFDCQIWHVDILVPGCRWLFTWSQRRGCHVWAQIGSEWPKIVQIRDCFNSGFCSFLAR